MIDVLELLVGIELELSTTPAEPDTDDFEAEECGECGHTPDYDEYGYESQLENWLEEWHYNNGETIDCNQWASDYMDTPAGWTLGEDASCGLEYRFSRPTPLGDAPELLCDLVNQLADVEEVRMHDCTGMHIHLDARPTSLVHIDPKVAWILWQNGWQSSAWELCRDRYTRIQQAYCTPMDLGLTWEQIRNGFYRNNDINFTNAHNLTYSKCTVELRLWDSTTDEDLNLRRLEWVHDFVSACLKAQTVPFDPFSESAAWERFCQ